MHISDNERLIAWGSELRAVHTRLRQALSIARESLAEGTDDAADAASDLLIYCRGFCTALSGHHRSEDVTLFPQIVAEKPELKPVIDKLMTDHGMLEYLINDLTSVMDAGADAVVAERHLDGIAAIMESHFAYEERQLLSVLDAAVIAGDKNEVLGDIA